MNSLLYLKSVAYEDGDAETPGVANPYSIEVTPP